MNLPIRFTPEAEDTFDAVKMQLKERWGDKFVSKFEGKVLSGLKTISSNPFIYSAISEKNDIRRCNLHKNCSMLYKVNEHDILIICFWDNRQDPLFSSDL